MTAPESAQKITLGEMRSGRAGTRALLVFCADYRCAHMIRLAADQVDQWPDDVRLSDLELKFICRKCGRRGADIRPDFHPPRMGAR